MSGERFNISKQITMEKLSTKLETLHCVYYINIIFPFPWRDIIVYMLIQGEKSDRSFHFKIQKGQIPNLAGIKLFFRPLLPS